MITYVTFSISIAFISWIVGIMINALLQNTRFYRKQLSNLNFIKSDALNKIIGLGVFKWIVKNTFFKFFNQKLQLKGKINMTDLDYLRKQMTISEIGHLMAFIFASLFAFDKFLKFNFLFGFTIMLVNVLMNLYPSLLQQVNKRRIDKLIKKTALFSTVLFTVLPYEWHPISFVIHPSHVL